MPVLSSKSFHNTTTITLVLRARVDMAHVSQQVQADFPVHANPDMAVYFATN